MGGWSWEHRVETLFLFFVNFHHLFYLPGNFKFQFLKMEIKSIK
jgi:hypothetical protein